MIVKCETDGSLTNHPAKQQVTDFLKNLVVDSLSLPPASKGPHTIDLLLEVCLSKQIHGMWMALAAYYARHKTSPPVDISPSLTRYQ